MFPLSLIAGPLISKAISVIPVKLVGYAVAVSMCVWLGWYLRDGKAQQERLEAVSQAIEQANEQHQIDLAILEDSVEIQREIEVRYRVIEKEAKVVAGECITDDWLRVYNDAIRATGSTTPYQ